MKILISESEGFPVESIKRLSQLGDVYIEGNQFEATEIDTLFIRLNKIIDKKTHHKFPKLKYIISPTTGTNHIDLSYFEKHQISVITLKNRSEFLRTIHATSEHTIALVLALLRNIPSATKSTLSGYWNRYPFKGNELNSSNILIYGYGRVGKQVAKLYSSFGCVVKAYDSEIDKVPKKYQCDIKSYLPQVDILSIHMDLNQYNHGIVDNKIMRLMKKNSKIINTSRGELINQDELFDNIIKGQISGAALDVLCKEPDPFSPKILNKIKMCGDRLILTPHISGFTFESLKKVENYVTEIFIKHTQDERKKNKR